MYQVGARADDSSRGLIAETSGSWAGSGRDSGGGGDSGGSRSGGGGGAGSTIFGGATFGAGNTALGGKGSALSGSAALLAAAHGIDKDGKGAGVVDPLVSLPSACHVMPHTECASPSNFPPVHTDPVPASAHIPCGKLAAGGMHLCAHCESLHLCSFVFGEPVRWGMTNKVNSARQCCNQCRDHVPKSDNDLSCNGASHSSSSTIACALHLC